MNFVNYCLYTKNYSALRALKDYSEIRTFAISKKAKKRIAGATAGAAVLAAGTYGALDRDASRYLRKLTNNQTEFDKEREAILNDPTFKVSPKMLDDMEDSETMRKAIKEMYPNDRTMRHRYLDLINHRSKIDDVNDQVIEHPEITKEIVNDYANSFDDFDDSDD